MTGRHGLQTCLKLKMAYRLKIQNQHMFHLKKQIKNQRALLELLKALSNEIAPNPSLIFESPPIFTATKKGAITVPTEYFKYYHATLGHLAQRYKNWLLVYNQNKDPAAFFGICYENLVQICTNWMHF
jgi:hypothetical protein